MGRTRYRAAWTALGVVLGWIAAPATADAGQTLDIVRKAGEVRCGIPTGSAGLAKTNDQGKWEGFHVDICHAIAAAALGAADKVEFIPVTDKTRFVALGSGEIDVLVTASAYTLARDTRLGITELVPYFYTGQGVLVRKDSGVKDLKDLDGATVCSTQGSLIEANLANYAKSAGITLNTVSFDKQDTVEAAFFAGRCDAISNDTLTLASNRLSSPAPADYTILPGLISKEPQGPFVRASDPEWGGLVKWTVYALFQAEEWGITPENVDAKKNSDDPAVKRFLAGGDEATEFGLQPDWTYQVVKQVGNYGTIYDRNIGSLGLGLDRGMNRAWNAGGLLMSPIWQ